MGQGVGGKEHGVIRKTDLHRELSFCNGTGFDI